jgi:hypothetical protein
LGFRFAESILSLSETQQGRRGNGAIAGVLRNDFVVDRDGFLEVAVDDLFFNSPIQ